MILENHQPFASPGEALEHYGVKGMRWGVRKEEDTSVGQTTTKPAKEVARLNESAKEYMAASVKLSQPVSPQRAAKNLAEHQTKFAEKLTPSNGDGKKKKLTPAQKKMLIGGAVGIGALGGLYLAKKYGVIDTSSLTKGVKPGEKISVEEFNRLRVGSQNAALGGRGLYVTPASFNRPGFELPAGHTFHRLSGDVETGFGHATYSVHSTEDLHRYLVGMGGGINIGANVGMQHVTWKSTKPVKVPALTEVLDTVRDVLADDQKVAPHTISKEEIVETYGKWSGGGWTQGTGYGGGRKVLEALKKKGYGAIVDEGDAGILGESPLVFFDSASAGRKTSKTVTKEDIQKAVDNLTEMHNRK